MKKYLLLFSFVFCFLVSKAQYSQGDVSFYPVPSWQHDSTTCQSNGIILYNLTIQNSFVGDTVKIKDMGGFLITSAVNTAGQNPWYITLPVIPINVPDYMLDASGNASTSGMPTKVICGPDTIYNIYNSITITVQDPCSYGNISGMVYIDSNSDCIYNAGDSPLNSVNVGIAQNFNSPSMTYSTYGAYTNSSGAYSALLQESWFTSGTAFIPSYFQFIFPLSSCNPQSYSFTTLPQANIDFALQCSSNLDVYASGGSPGAARPNIPFFLHPIVGNIGCTPASGQMKLVLDPNVIYNPALSTNLPALVNGDTLIWNYSNINSIGNGPYWNSFLSGIHLTPNPSVNIGDTLCFRVFTNVPPGDVNAANNDYSFCLPVVNSYDPNIKEVSPAGIGTQGLIPSSTSELTYAVHFQNTGNAPAINIYIIDTLDADIQPNSVQILGTSHTMIPEYLSSNIVRFNFNSIYLADSTSNEPASHGFVRFKVKLNTGLAPGTPIANTAYIYFDSNPAVITNTILNTINASTFINENVKGTFAIYPNPASESVMLSFGTSISNGRVRVMNVSGQEVINEGISGSEFNLGIAQLPTGIYVIEISGNGTTERSKLVKY